MAVSGAVEEKGNKREKVWVSIGVSQYFSSWDDCKLFANNALMMTFVV